VEDTNEIWNKIKEGINEAAGKVIGKENNHKGIFGFRKNVK
jgi:hypothetical protein